MNFLIACIVFLVIHGAKCAVDDTSISVLYAAEGRCDKEGVLGCDQNCTALRYCLNYNEISIKCQTQHKKPFCNPDTLQCEDTVGVCPTQPAGPFTCPGLGNYPFASDCKKFWICPPKPPAVESICLGNWIFNAATKKCEAVSYTNPCVKFSDLCKGKMGSIVVHTQNKGSYAYCQEGFPVVSECPAKHIYSLNKMGCEYQCKASGIFEDPVKRECYYICTSSYPSYKVENKCCPGELIFDATAMACVPIM